MDEKYILRQVLTKGNIMRTAQREYRKQPGDPRKDPIKLAYKAEQTRREQDFDIIMKEAEKALAVLQLQVKENIGQGPPESKDA
jgi:hypothetical protein